MSNIPTWTGVGNNLTNTLTFDSVSSSGSNGLKYIFTKDVYTLSTNVFQPPLHELSFPATYDPFNSWNGSVYTVPKTGYYLTNIRNNYPLALSYNISSNGRTRGYFTVYKNGSSFKTIDGYTKTEFYFLPLNINDTLSFSYYYTGTTSDYVSINVNFTITIFYYCSL